ncbi:MAG: DUF6526 family protein [Bryobacteraceae bacterium]
MVQTFANHTRWQPAFHFFLAPILLLNVIWSITQLIRAPSWDRAEILLLSLALAVTGGLVRLNPLKAQDRLIRLEEQQRYQSVLSPDLAAKASELPVSQIVALRFAADAEHPSLVEQILAGTLIKPKDIKQAIKTRRGDYFRV